MKGVNLVVMAACCWAQTNRDNPTTLTYGELEESQRDWFGGVKHSVVCNLKIDLSACFNTRMHLVHRHISRASCDVSQVTFEPNVMLFIARRACNSLKGFASQGGKEWEGEYSPHDPRRVSSPCSEPQPILWVT